METWKMCLKSTFKVTPLHSEDLRQIGDGFSWFCQGSRLEQHFQATPNFTHKTAHLQKWTAARVTILKATNLLFFLHLSGDQVRPLAGGGCGGGGR